MAEAARLFGAVAAEYAAHRLSYPDHFFSGFADRCSQRQRVWDCGCGNGQASLALAEQFEAVIATDASGEQLASAFPHPRVHYQQAQASCSGLKTGSVDAVLVAAAVHWFAGDAFNAEVRRVCRPGAAMAWIGYLPLRLPSESLQVVLDHFYDQTLAPWWPPQRRWVDQAYAGLPFPGHEWPFPSNLWIERQWDLQALMGYLGTWSAVQAARQAGIDPLPPLQQEFAALWPDGGRQPLLLRWPFMGRWGAVA
jgi:SAM-dependent methyltransferase